MEIDVTKIPSLTEGYVKTAANGDVSVTTTEELLGVPQSNILYLDANSYSGTPVKGDAKKPYQTHASALAAYNTGDVIQIVGAHTTTTNLAKDGVVVVYNRPTVNDGIEYTPNGTSMIFTGADTTGTGVVLLGEGFTKATGSSGAPCVQMTGGTNADTFIVRGGTFEPNAKILLLGGTGGVIDFSPKEIVLNTFPASNSLMNGSIEFGEMLKIHDFDIRVNTQVSTCGFLGVNFGDDGTNLIIDNIKLTSSVTQVATDNYLIELNSSVSTGKTLVGRIYNYINDVKVFDDLIPEVNPHKLTLTGDVSTVGNIGITTALDSDLDFQGVGTIKASDRIIDLLFNDLTPIKYVDDNGTSPNIAANSDFNTIDPLTDTNIIGGGGRSGNFPNKIGSPTKPNGLDVTPYEWADDTGYVSGSASVAAITGGYDGINNQLAGTLCGGGHNFIKYNVFAHSVIVGGSYNVNAAGRSFIGGGRGNSQGNDVQFAFTGCGDGNIIRDQASFSSIVNGFFCTIWGSARSVINSGVSNIIRCIGVGNVIASGDNNVIGDNETTDNSERCVINGGNDNEILNSSFAFIGTGQTGSIDNADYATIINGNNISIENGAVNSSAFGDDVTVTDTGRYSLTYGLRVVGRIQGSLTHGARRNSVSGDCQNVSFNIGNTTTDDTAKYLAVEGGATYAPMEDNTNWVGVTYITGRDASNGNTYSCKIEFSVRRHGDVETIQYENRTDFVDDFALTTKPSINLHADGLFRIFVKGDVGDTILWSGRVDVATVSG